MRCLLRWVAVIMKIAYLNNSYLQKYLIINSVLHLKENQTMSILFIWLAFELIFFLFYKKYFK